MKKKFLAFFCALALSFALLPAASANSYDGIYLVGVNDTVLLGLITPDLMPVRRSGIIYAPYTILDSGALGLVYALNKSAGTFTIYNRSQTLIFQTTGDGSADKDGNSYENRIITRNGRVYIPLRFVASFFNLSYSFFNLVLPDGGAVPIARLSNEDVKLNDNQFSTSAVQLVAQPLAQYLQSHATPTPSTPTTAPTTNPSPSPNQPTTSPLPGQPTPTPTVSPVANRTVYLAFACTDGSGFSSLLDTLALYRRTALLLFTPDQLASRDSDVRRGVSMGHQIGLLLPQEGAAAAFQQGNSLLALIAHTTTNLVAFQGGGTQEGDWTVFRSNLIYPSRSNSTRQSAVILDGAARREGTLRIMLNDSTLMSGALGQLLQTFGRAPYQLVVPTETNLER